MASNTVVIFGAGAAKACGGQLTSEILFDLSKFKEGEGIIPCKLDNQGSRSLSFWVEVNSAYLEIDFASLAGFI